MITLQRRLLVQRRPLPAFFSDLSPAKVAATDVDSYKKKKRGRAQKRNYDRVNLRRSLITEFAAHNDALEKKATKLGLRWETEACTLVERTRTVTPDMPQWESEWIEVRDSLDYYKLHDWPKGIGPMPPDEIDYESSGTGF
jgi:hypothetical protein